MLAGGKIRKILNYKKGSAKTEPIQERQTIATLALCFSRALNFEPREDLYPAAVDLQIKPPPPR